MAENINILFKLLIVHLLDFEFHFYMKNINLSFPVFYHYVINLKSNQEQVVHLI